MTQEERINKLSRQKMDYLVARFLDLKTTINLINLLIDKAPADGITPIQRRYLRKIKINISHAEYIVNRVLEAGSIDESREEALLEAHAEVDKLIQQCVREFDETVLTFDDVLIERADQIILENLQNEKFNVSMLAEKLKLGNKQVYRKLKHITGQTPVNYIRSKRMQQAALLLHRKLYTVSEIMYKVGFSNASYFTRCFTHEFGMSPSDYLLL